MYDLCHGWEVQVPHMDVVPPKGRSLEGRGVEPDVLLTPAQITKDPVAFAEARKILGS